ncbi:MAG: hypothetical protein ACI9TH_004363, partial [Kiritimatiellia bacterium]
CSLEQTNNQQTGRARFSSGNDLHGQVSDHLPIRGYLCLGVGNAVDNFGVMRLRSGEHLCPHPRSQNQVLIKLRARRVIDG